MVLITIDRLLYKISNKDYSNLEKLEHDETSTDKEFNTNI